MNYLKLKIFIALFIITCSASAQDSVFARRIVDTLSSRYFWGRGYTNDGMAKARAFLTAQLRSFGVSPLDGKSFEQPISYPINTFPGKMDVSINGIKLTPGKDFIVSPDSRGVHTSGTLLQKDSVTYVDPINQIVVLLQDKLTWSAEQRLIDYTIIDVNKKSLQTLPATITANIENQFIPDFKTANICGIVRGTMQPDSVIVYTAHYDHLGGMGSSTYFPGANDNASGVSQVLSLAKYYAAHPQPYSIGFILFAGEEAGLVGSKYFTEHPLVPLQNIRFLVNLDLEGTGIDGITVVNATVFPKEFQLLKQINNKGKYLAAIKPRGKAANSDHYYFSENGVPAFFIYTLGGIKAYHDVYDINATLPLNEISNEFHLLLKFNAALMNEKQPD